MQTTSISGDLNRIFLRRACRLYLPNLNNAHEAPANMHASLVANLEYFGYLLSEDLFKQLTQLPLDALQELNEACCDALRARHNWAPVVPPMYPNFPQQVMEMADALLYINALVHYFTDGKFIPPAIKKPRAALAEYTNYQKIELGSLSQFEELFRPLLDSPVSLDQQAQSDLIWFLRIYLPQNGRNPIDFIEKPINNREIKAVVLKAIYLYSKDNPEYWTQVSDYIVSQLSTAIDVLRFTAALSDADISLANRTKYKTFDRKTRHLLLRALELTPHLAEDLSRYPKRFVRLAEKLHPGEFKDRYPQFFDAITKVRNNKPLERFSSLLESYLASDIGQALSLLKTRPGELSRRLDLLLRRSPDQPKSGSDADTDPNTDTGKAEWQQQVLSVYDTVIGEVPTPSLLQMAEHFKHRHKKRACRVFMPKGPISKAFCLKDKLPLFSETLCHNVVQLIEDELKQRFAKLPPLGKCYVSSDLKRFNQPFALRSASKALYTAARGSRFDLSTKDTLRLFVFWRNGLYRTDLDLSAIFFQDDLSHYATIAYYDLKHEFGCHSGDIVDAPQGASEFVDFSIKKCLAKKIRYVVMSVCSYTRQSYCELPECFAGWMAREKPQSGEIYEPRTIENKLDLSADSKIAVPVIFDLVERQAIWCDLSLKAVSLNRLAPQQVGEAPLPTSLPTSLPTAGPTPFQRIRNALIGLAGNNPINNQVGFSMMLNAMVNLKKANLYDLFRLHAEARGELVSDKAMADRVFAYEENPRFILDLAAIAAEFM
jgi:hypothetical protein